MWRSRAPTIILRVWSRQKFIHSPIPPTTRFAPSPPASLKWYASICSGLLNPKFFSSTIESSPAEDQTSHCTLSLEKNQDFTSEGAKCFSVELGEYDTPPTAFGEEPDVSNTVFSENEIAGGDELSCIRKENTDRDVSLDTDEVGEEAGAQVPEVIIEQLESVICNLQRTLPQEIGSSLDMLEEFTLTEEFVVRVFQDSHVSGENLVSFFRWAIKKAPALKCFRLLHLLIQIISASDDLGKMEVYALWDLTKDLANTKGIVTTEMLNQLIYIFWKLGKAKAALEVFNKFDKFGCAPDGNTYYFTIEALGKKSKINIAWSVCEKMINSRCLPDDEKIDKIIIFFCKGKKAKKVYSVYLLARENKISIGRDTLSFLIGGLGRKDESVQLALELLEHYPQNSLKYEYKTFSFVLQSLTRIKDVKAAKSLLLRMVDSGPPPGNSAFHLVITGLCNEGEVEDAISLIKVMESRGLRPDQRTFNVIMSGFAMAGLMTEAFKIFCEAKKKHKVLTAVPYHILIRGYCKMEEYEKALECLKDMKEQGIHPNSNVYSKLIESLCLKALDWRTAEKIQEEMKESGLHLKRETLSIMAAVKMIEEEETAADESKMVA